MSNVIFHDGPIISRRTAAQQGSKFYFTGKPCKRGHVAQRYTSGFSCVVCNSLHAEKWHTDNPELAILKGRRYRERYPEKRALATKKWRESHPEVVRTTAKEWLNSNPEKRAEYLKRQKLACVAKREKALGRKKPLACESCGDLESSSDKGTRIVFDHNHETGAARGWICHNCNIAIGHVKDSVDRLRKLANYIETRGHPRGHPI